MATQKVGFLVVGTPRSGTTLVQRLALELGGVAMPPETHFFTDFAPALLSRRRFPLDHEGLTDELGAFCRLPSSVGMALDSATVIDRLGGHCTSPLQLFDAVVGTLCGPAELLGEKTPEHLRWWRPLLRARAEMRFVAVVRDPRAVVVSNLEAPFRASAHEAWGDDYFLALALHWRHHQRLVLALADELGPSRCLLLRYEDVVERPSDSRAVLAAHLARPLGSEHAVAPAGVVLPWESWKTGAFDEITDGRVDAWCDQLPAGRARTVAGVCRREMSRLGYDTGEARYRGLTRPLGVSGATRRRLRGLAAGLIREQATIDRAVL